MDVAVNACALDRFRHHHHTHRKHIRKAISSDTNYNIRLIIKLVHTNHVFVFLQQQHMMRLRVMRNSRH